VQVNVAREPQKSGCDPEALPRLLEAARRRPEIRCEGLMTIPPAEGDPAPHFRALRELAREHGLAQLSMGMSGDFEVAVEEGATIVRVGEAIFGPRPTRGGERADRGTTHVQAAALVKERQR
jgi:hypothetical protein